MADEMDHGHEWGFIAMEVENDHAFKDTLLRRQAAALLTLLQFLFEQEQRTGKWLLKDSFMGQFY